MGSAPSIGKKAGAEFLGTFVCVLVGAGSAVAAQSLGASDPSSLLLLGALANGLGLAVAVSATMAVSGGSLNPAVTLALAVARKIPAKDVVPYIVAELAGALLAGLALVYAFPSQLGGAVNWGSPSLASGVSVGTGTMIELLMTFVLMFAIYGTAVDSRAPKIGGFGIGLAVLADVLAGGPFTGAAMNPARAMGPMIASGFIPSYWFVYWLGPVVGAVLAAVAYKYAVEGKA